MVPEILVMAGSFLIGTGINIYIYYSFNAKLSKRELDICLREGELYRMIDEVHLREKNVARREHGLPPCQPKC